MSTADSPRQRGGQSAPIPESLQRLWWVGGQSGPEGRTVRDRSRELAAALLGWRTVRPSWIASTVLDYTPTSHRSGSGSPELRARKVAGNKMAKVVALVSLVTYSMKCLLEEVL